MSLSVDAIRNYTGSTNCQKPSKRAVSAPQQNDSAVSFGESNAMKKARNYTLATIMGVPVICGVGSTLTGCSADAEAFAVAVAQDNHKCCDCHGWYIPDTVIKHDSIYIPGDSVYIKDNFKSPVIDTLNAILDDVGVDRGRGYVPLRISFIDEQDSKFRRYPFDGRSSGVDQVVYRGTRTPFNEAMGRYIVGTPNDEHELYMLSLTEDGKLFARHMVPKLGAKNFDKIDNYMIGPTSYVLDRDRTAKLIRKFDVAREQVGREYSGTYEKGDLPKSIMITNPYDTKWRYTDVNVVSGNPYYGENE